MLGLNIEFIQLPVVVSIPNRKDNKKQEKTIQNFTGNSFKLQGRGGLVFAVLYKYTQGK